MLIELSPPNLRLLEDVLHHEICRFQKTLATAEDLIIVGKASRSKERYFWPSSAMTEATSTVERVSLSYHRAATWVLRSCWLMAIKSWESTAVVGSILTNMSLGLVASWKAILDVAMAIPKVVETKRQPPELTSLQSFRSSPQPLT